MLRNFKYFLFFLFFLCYSGSLIAQEKHEYLGVIKLNDSSFISYKLHLIENNGLISGYSVTDIQGEHETKSTITGTYNNKTNQLSFREIGIVYTKSLISDYDFCYIHFNGKIGNINSKKNIAGKFNGQYSDGSTCIDGEIDLKDIRKIEKKAQKIDKIIQKSKRITDEVKSNINLRQTLDSLNMNILKSNQNLSMFSSSTQIKLKIYDAGKVDGDKINLFINDTIVLKNYVVSKKIKKIIIALTSEKTTIKVRAINVGSISPNTTKIEIIDKNNNIKTLTSLKKGEKASITIIKVK
ncbi:MAG: hypothetical protein JKY16_06760 [Lutibacter sp.]|nr:hypothetical protein [Lutibacter sp.]